jgi:MFS family permease
MRTPVRNVLLSEVTTPSTYGRVFGFERAMDSAGAVIGPLAAILLLKAFSDGYIHRLFLMTLIPGVLAALCIAVLVREHPHVTEKWHRVPAGIGQLPSTFNRYLLGIGIAGLGDFSNTLLILWATNALTPKFGIEGAAECAMGLYVSYNIIYALSSYVSGHLADMVDMRRMLAAGYVLSIIPAAILLTPSSTLSKFFAVFAFSGLYMGIWETLENSVAASVLPDSVRGLGFGVLDAVQGIGDLVSSIVIGVLWVVRPTLAMSFAIGTALIGAAVILRTSPARSDPSNPFKERGEDHAASKQTVENPIARRSV